MRISKLGAMTTIIAIAAVSLTACTSETTPTSQVLTVGWTTGGDQEALEAVAEAFAKDHPGFELKGSYIAGDQYQQTIKTQLTAGSAPDAFLVLPGSGGIVTVGTLAEAGYLADLSDRSWAGSVPEQFKAASGYEGKQYLVPLGIANLAPVFNMTAMDTAGLSVPTTWTEVLEFCADAKTAGKTAFAFGNQDGTSSLFMSYALAASLVDGAHPEFPADLAAGKATFPESGWVDVFEHIKELADNDCFQPQFDGTPTETAQNLMTSGDGLAFVWFSNSIAAFTNANSGNTYDSWAMPATDNPDETYMSAALTASLAVNDSAKNKDLAMQFADFLASPEGSKIYTDISNVIPVNRGSDYQVPQGAEGFVELIDAGRTAPFPDQAWPNPKVQQDLIAGLQQYLAGTATVEDVLAKMQTSYDTAD